MFKIVFLDGERNDATDYYVQMIRKGLEQQGHQVVIINDIKKIEKKDKVLTISLKAFFYTWLRNPRQFIIHWFQGVTPEEALLIYTKSIQKRLRWFYLSFFEKFVLHFSKFNFFVSKAMFEHYKKKYNYNKVNYMLMPCYNQPINLQAFNDQKYIKPSFVYVGSLSDWQCIKETLQIFKQVQAVLPDAVMYLFTSEKEKAQNLIDLNNIVNIFIDYVPYAQLNEKLKNIKYGFLIRDNIVVNQVATPTKMNGYLANGVIPVYSNVIDDFKLNLNGSYLINSTCYQDMADKIIDFESNIIDANTVLHEYQGFFENYYSDQYYLDQMILKFKEFKVS